MSGCHDPGGASPAQPGTLDDVTSAGVDGAAMEDGGAMEDDAAMEVAATEVAATASADVPLPGPGPAAAPSPEPARAPEWWRHDNERWVVGDGGQQSAVVPVPAAIGAARPDTTCDGARLADVEYRAVSLRGLGHQQAGTPRQDSYLLRVTSDERWLVGCVADGVSASPLSHLAADVACEEITGTLADALADFPLVSDPGAWGQLVPRLPWQLAVDRASAAIVRAAIAASPAPVVSEPVVAEPAVPEPAGSVPAGSVPAGSGRGVLAPGAPGGWLRDAGETRLSEPAASRLMATTAVGFLTSVNRTPDGLVPYALVVAAGDSSALVLSAGRWHPVTAVKNAGSDMASNAVRALPRRVRARPAAGFLRPGEALAVISDGIGDPLGQGTGVVGRFLARHWSCAPDLLAFAGHAAFYRRTFIDDRTAVVIWNRRVPGSDPVPPGGEAGPSD